MSSNGWQKSRTRERWQTPTKEHSSKKEVISSNTASPSTMILRTGNTEAWPKNNFNEKMMSLTVNDSVMAHTWRTRVWEQNQVLQNFNSDSKFPVYAAQFLHLKFIKKEECKRLSACSIKLAVYGKKSWHIFPVCRKL